MIEELDVSAEQLESLTLIELAEINRLSGVKPTDLRSGTVPPWEFIQAMVYVLRRRRDPSFTFEDAGNLTLGELAAILNPKGLTPSETTPWNGNSWS